MLDLYAIVSLTIEGINSPLKFCILGLVSEKNGSESLCFG
jgi:hypothetical protein